METLLREWRYGLRTLTKSPGFAAIAALTLALRMGASTAIFSVVDAVLLRALPYPDPQKIVRVWEKAPNGHRRNSCLGGIVRCRCSGNSSTWHLRSCGLFGYVPHRGDRHSFGPRRRAQGRTASRRG